MEREKRGQAEVSNTGTKVQPGTKYILVQQQYYSRPQYNIIRVPVSAMDTQAKSASIAFSRSKTLSIVFFCIGIPLSRRSCLDIHDLLRGAIVNRTIFC